MDEQKQIEEMAELINIQLPDYEHSFRDCLNAAEKLYKKGYRKIPEGAVVLTREESQKYAAYKIIEPLIRGCLDRERELEKRLETIRKETAREFAKDLSEERRLLGYEDNDFCMGATRVDAKQYGVEVE